MVERAGIAISTWGNIEKGSPSVSMGHYLQVLSILRLDEDLIQNYAFELFLSNGKDRYLQILLRYFQIDSALRGIV